MSNETNSVNSTLASNQRVCLLDNNLSDLNKNFELFVNNNSIEFSDDSNTYWEFPRDK